MKKFERVRWHGDARVGEQATLFRAIAARANDPALDSSDMGVPPKSSAGGFANASKADYDKLKNVGRYLVDKPGHVWHFKVVDGNPGEMITHTDTDFAGCPKTRRCTSWGVVLRAGHPIKSYSKTQSTVCLSSAEAELGGILTAASVSFGLQSVARDLGTEWSIELRADASAAIGICRRRGLGKVRHLHTADLWVQDRLKSGDFALRKTPGSENIADMMTKYLARPDLVKHIAAMNVRVEEGRASLAPKIAEDITAKDVQATAAARPQNSEDKRGREKGSAAPATPAKTKDPKDKKSSPSGASGLRGGRLPADQPPPLDPTKEGGERQTQAQDARKARRRLDQKDQVKPGKRGRVQKGKRGRPSADQAAAEASHRSSAKIPESACMSRGEC